MDPFSTGLTTTIDVQLAPALCGTPLNAPRRWLERSTTLALLIAMWAYALRIFAAAIGLGRAFLAAAAALGAGYFLALRRSHRAQNASRWSAARSRSTQRPSMNAPTSGYSATCARVDDD
jgi:hypothetical protein